MVVVGGPPMMLENIVDTPSPISERWSPGFLKKFRPTILLMTIWWPMCSLTVTNTIGSMTIISPTFHVGS